MTVDSPVKRLRVAIIGGGPGGLSTAIALSQIANVDVALYEQANVLREVGAGISIGPNTWNVLELLGVADSLTSGHATDTVLNMYVQRTRPGKHDAGTVPTDLAY
jgi:salicylate hydroxylase